MKENTRLAVCTHFLPAEILHYLRRQGLLNGSAHDETGKRLQEMVGGMPAGRGSVRR
jgi:hypothetical protein